MHFRMYLSELWMRISANKYHGQVIIKKAERGISSFRFQLYLTYLADS